jgi:NAD(P)-dependent dehydrogenase (short-subunit alcohol dehydrogenase family)
MSDDFFRSLYSLQDAVAVVTGGTGTLGGAMAHGLARAGARVAVLGRNDDRARSVAEAIGQAGGIAIAVLADVLQREELEAARDTIVHRWGSIDILVNAAGGNVPGATTGPDRPFFDLSKGALEEVIDLNLLGTILPSQVFGAEMARAGQGCIVNISSMAAGRALTRVVGYGAAKAAVEGLTRWLAVDLARTHGPRLRVNAIAPGFFLAEQNRSLLVQADGTLTTRGQSIVDHTPAARFGEPSDLISTLVWLCGPGAGFINGVVIPVDGGFGAFSGV